MLNQTGYCWDCKGRYLAVRTNVDRNQHWLLCCVTGGLWLLVCRLFSARYGIWSCDNCGGRRIVGIRGIRHRPRAEFPAVRPVAPASTAAAPTPAAPPACPSPAPAPEPAVAHAAPVAAADTAEPVTGAPPAAVAEGAAAERVPARPLSDKRSKRKAKRRAQRKARRDRRKR